jgi:hypothetical protein
MCAAVLQGKRIDNTSVRDEPYEFVLGTGQVLCISPASHGMAFLNKQHR